MLCSQEKINMLILSLCIYTTLRLFALFVQTCKRGGEVKNESRDEVRNENEKCTVCKN